MNAVRPIQTTHEEVSEYIADDPHTDAEVAEWLGITLKAAQGHLYRLRDKGRAVRLADGRWTSGTEAGMALQAMRQAEAELAERVKRDTAALERLRAGIRAMTK